MLHLSGTLTASRVLIVDDDIDFAESVADILEARGFTIATAKDTATALQRIDSFGPHVALIDLRLGQESGTELIARIRAHHANLVCILMTAYAAFDSAVQALRSKADDYLCKPLQPENVLNVVGSAAQRVRAHTRAERRERFERLGSVAAGVAHDLNNLLTVVLAESESLEHQFTGRAEPVNAGLRLIRESSSRAAQLVHELLALARGVPDAEPCTNPREVLLEAVGAVAGTLPSGATLDCDVTLDSDTVVTLGASQLYRVALNLLCNARDAITARGHIALRGLLADPSAVLGSRNGHATCLFMSVTDDGIGIDAPVMEHLFEPFFTTKPNGSGLGLATAYGLVRAAGGELLVESRPGMGTEFDVWIPLRSPNAVDDAPTRIAVGGLRPSELVASLHQAAAEPILVCDDDPLVLSVMTRMLRDLGHEVSQASGVEEALRCWREGRHSTVLTDLRLGQQCGIDLARAILAERPDARVLLVSGDFSDSDPRDPIWARVEKLRKPFDRATLRAAILGLRQS